MSSTPPLLSALALALAVSAPTARAADVPALSGRVVDRARILTPERVRRIEALSAAYEARTGGQIAVLLVPSLDGEPIEDFAERVFRTWRLGQREKDNGILLVIAPDDRRVRIEVGYGLEGSLTDAAAGRIIRNVIAPAFREDAYGRGVEEGVKAVIATLDGDPQAGAPVERHGPAVSVLLFLLAALTGLFAATSRRLGPGFLYFLGWFVASAALGALYFLAYLPVYVAAELFWRRRRPPGWFASVRPIAELPIDLLEGLNAASGSSDRRSSSGWSYHSSSFGGGGFSGGGGSSGGGFSGGGGSSGGGGASGSW
jgi:uncharacterized protein